MAMDKFKNRTILLSIISILIFALGTKAKESSLKNLPQPDMSFELIQRFYRTNEYMFVLNDVEDTVKYKNIWMKCKMIKPDVRAILKYENQLHEQESKRLHLLALDILLFVLHPDSHPQSLANSPASALVLGIHQSV